MFILPLAQDVEKMNKTDYGHEEDINLVNTGQPNTVEKSISPRLTQSGKLEDKTMVNAQKMPSPKSNQTNESRIDGKPKKNWTAAYKCNFCKYECSTGGEMLDHISFIHNVKKGAEFEQNTKKEVLYVGIESQFESPENKTEQETIELHDLDEETEIMYLKEQYLN